MSDERISFDPKDVDEALDAYRGLTQQRRALEKADPILAVLRDAVFRLATLSAEAARLDAENERKREESARLDAEVADKRTRYAAEIGMLEDRKARAEAELSATRATLEAEITILKRQRDEVKAELEGLRARFA